MKILLVNPEFPNTFWSFKHALRFVSKKAAFPPLGLLTVASMLPNAFKTKLVDMNVSKLRARDILWADMVFVGGMIVQKDSANKVLKLCKILGVRTVAGGPLFTAYYEEFPSVDHLVLNDAEITLPQFLADLENNCAKRIYASDQFADIVTTPLPRWELLDMKQYSSMAIQYSRGCPFDCEFCDIVVLNGHTPRTKSKMQVLYELDALRLAGWTSSVFIVDDNFIGNKNKLKSEILPAIWMWSRQNNFPFSFNIQTSINLADDDELIYLMVAANFTQVFIGIESPNEDSLTECGKSQNLRRDLTAAVKKLQNLGLEVQGGFIVGFDNDKQSIFQDMIDFIQNSGISTAMVGLLQAPMGTKLYKRLKSENRINCKPSGDNTDYSMNFSPRIDFNILLDGYKKVVRTIYSPKHYYKRVKTFLREYRPAPTNLGRIRKEHVNALFMSFWQLGILEKGRRHYWKLLVWTLFKRPRLFPLSVTLAIYGYHFRRVANMQA